MRRRGRWLVMFLDANGVPAVYREYDDLALAGKVAATLSTTIRGVWVVPNPDYIAEEMLGHGTPGAGEWEVELWQEVLRSGGAAVA